MPVNALIALCTPGDLYPSTIADAGYDLAAVEVPVAASSGKLVIDVVAFRSAKNLFLTGEAKSGANVEKDQARRYAQIDSDQLVVAANVTVRVAGDRHLQPVYVCIAENLDRIMRGLQEADLACPVLAVASDRVEHHRTAFFDADLQTAFASAVATPGPPPRIIPVDEESPDDAFDLLVLPALVSTLSHQRQQVSIPTLAEQALLHLVIYGKAARNRLISKVDAAAQRAAERDPATFEYKGRTALRDHAIVRFVRSPEETKRQGRTQVYQSIARAAGKPARRRVSSRDQMALFDDLIEELEQADEVAGTDEATNDEDTP